VVPTTQGISGEDKKCSFSDDNTHFPTENYTVYNHSENVDVSESKFVRLVFELFNFVFYG